MQEIPEDVLVWSDGLGGYAGDQGSFLSRVHSLKGDHLDEGRWFLQDSAGNVIADNDDVFQIVKDHNLRLNRQHLASWSDKEPEIPAIQINGFSTEQVAEYIVNWKPQTGTAQEVIQKALDSINSSEDGIAAYFERKNS